MDQQQLLFAFAGALLVNSLILYVIISSATRAEKRAKYEWAQLQLLAKIAMIQGVKQEEITEVFKIADKK